MSRLLPFHDWLRDTRYRLVPKVTQTELAERIGCTQSTIVRLESGKHTPLLSSVGKVAQALKIDIDLVADTRGRVLVWPYEVPKKKTGTDG